MPKNTSKDTYDKELLELVKDHDFVLAGVFIIWAKKYNRTIQEVKLMLDFLGGM
jgi:hypothetical protein